MRRLLTPGLSGPAPLGLSEARPKMRFDLRGNGLSLSCLFFESDSRVKALCHGTASVTTDFIASMLRSGQRLGGIPYHVLVVLPRADSLDMHKLSECAGNG